MATTLELKVRLKALDEMSRTFKAIEARNSKLIQKFNASRDALRKMREQMKSVEVYRKQEKSLSELAANMEKARQKARELKEQWKASRAEGNIAAMKKLAESHEKATQKVRGMAAEHRRLKDKLGSAAAKLREAGINTNRLGDAERNLQNNIRRTNTALDSQSQKLKTLSERHQTVVARKQAFQDRLAISANASMAGYVSLNAARRAAHVIAAPVREYMGQEQASTDLKVTMMRADGTFGAFEEINKQAKQLGNVLPGTTQDFIHLAKSLKEQGVGDHVLTSGGLRNAAEMAVLMNMGQEEGGTFMARMIEAHGLNPADLQKAADMTQRAYHAFGLKKEDMAESMKYYAPTVNALGLTGEENYRKLLAIQGMAARQGLEGSMFGTNFSMMLSKLGEGPRALMMAKKGMKAEARDALKKAGVRFNFFNKDGSLKDIEAIVKEMEKFDVIRQKLGDEEALLAMRQMFGEQGGRVAKILAQQGVEGLRQALGDIAGQADMQDRIAEKTSTLAAAFEQLEGVSTAVSGAIGETLREDLLKWAAIAQTFVEETLQPWLENNKGLVKGLMLGAVALTAMAAVGGLALLVFAGLNSAFAVSALSLHKFAAAIKWIGGGIMALGRMMMANPVMLAISLIIVGLWLLYKNWDKISAFMLRIGERVKTWWKNFSFRDLIQRAVRGVGNIFRNMGSFILAHLKDTGGRILERIRNWDIMGAIAEIFLGVFRFFANLGSIFWGLLVAAGQSVIEAIRGWSVMDTMREIFGPAIDWVSGKIAWLVDGIKNAGKELGKLMGAQEENILLREDLKPKSFAELQAQHAARQQKEGAAQKAIQDAHTLREKYPHLKLPAVNESLIKQQHDVAPSPAEVIRRHPPAGNPQASTINIHLDVDGMGNKEAVALIRAEIGKEISAKQREMAARGRSSMYDAALA